MTTNSHAPDRVAIDLMPAAIDAFGLRVHGVGPEGWSRDTTCSPWSVRDLVNHVTSEHLWAPELLAGRTIADVGSRFDGDVLGGRPEDAWQRAASASVQAWRACGPETPVHLSFGDVPTSEYADQMLLDLVVHGWDLAVSTARAGQPEPARVDPEQVAHVLGYVRAHAGELAGSGLFGTAAPDDGGDGLDTLLRLVGRDPGWRPGAGTAGRPST